MEGGGTHSQATSLRAPPPSVYEPKPSLVCYGHTTNLLNALVDAAKFAKAQVLASPRNIGAASDVCFRLL